MLRNELTQELGAVTQAIVLLGGELHEIKFVAVSQEQLQVEKLISSQQQERKAEGTILEAKEKATVAQSFQYHERHRILACF